MSESFMAESSVTQKFQATIPLKVREELGIQSGDKLIFKQNDNGDIVVQKKVINPVDWDYLKSVEDTLSEWNSPEDDEAYGDL